VRSIGCTRAMPPISSSSRKRREVSWWVPDSCMQTATYALPAIRWTTSTVRIVARLVERRALRDEASRSCGVP
jgi:hypothetical protein